MTHEARTAMGNAAISAARAIDYAGAGTVEFIVDTDGRFYFMEMNTRLQVEHLVTELITGQDLVEWQLRVAAGERLPVSQEQLAIDGHALEARIYAEDPDNRFLPATGRLNHLRFPARTSHVRIDTGVRQGDSISVHYDPLIAKLIVRGSDRRSCLRRMLEALSQTQVAGVTTNTDFLTSVISHEAFQAADFDTGFIERHHADLFPDKEAVHPDILCLAALYQVLWRATLASQQAASSADPTSPWWATGNWRLNLVEEERFRFHDGVSERGVTITRATRHHSGESQNPVKQGAAYGGTLSKPLSDNMQGPALEKLLIQGQAYNIQGQTQDQAGMIYIIGVDGQSIHASGSLAADGRLRAILENTQIHVSVVEDREHLIIFEAGHTYRLKRVSDTDYSGEEEASGNLISPMPGTIIEVTAAEGQQVKKGDALLVLEAMKIEHIISAPHDGTVQSLHYRTGDMVDEGVELLALADPKLQDGPAGG